MVSASMERLAEAYQLQDKHADATKLIAELLAQPRTDSAGPLINLHTGLVLHGRDLVREKKYIEAEPPLRECLAIQAKWPSLPGRSFVNAHLLLGASLLGQKKYAEAEPLLVKGCNSIVVGFQSMKPRPDDQTGLPLTPLDMRVKIEALGLLVQLYQEWDKPDEVVKWQKELEAFKQAWKKTGKQP